MRISFFKLPKAKAFDYKPLYYDPKKDKENELKQNQNSFENNQMRMRLKAEMNDKWAIGRNKSKQARGFINQRNLLIYIAVALLLLYFIFK